MRRFGFAALQVIGFALPWRLRRAILNCVPGVEIARSARVGLSILLARKVILEDEAIIGNFNFVNDIDVLHFRRFAKIGRNNWVTGANSDATMFSGLERKCGLFLDEHARVTASHHIDCTGGVYIGAYSTIAGIRTQILTHGIDFKASKQVCKSTVVGRYSFVGTGSILLMGTVLPDYSVLGAGAVLNKAFAETCAVYAGNPARLRKRLDKGSILYFSRKKGHVE